VTVKMQLTVHSKQSKFHDTSEVVILLSSTQQSTILAFFRNPEIFELGFRIPGLQPLVACSACCVCLGHRVLLSAYHHCIQAATTDAARRSFVVLSSAQKSSLITRRGLYSMPLTIFSNSPLAEWLT